MIVLSLVSGVSIGDVVVFNVADDRQKTLPFPPLGWVFASTAVGMLSK